MKTMYVNDGVLIDYTAPAAVKRGDIVVLGGKKCGIAYNNAEKGTLVPVYVKGRFTVPAKTGTAITAGTTLYYDAAAGTVSATAGDVTIGMAACDMIAAGVEVDVILA